MTRPAPNMTTRTAAEALGVSVHTVARWAGDGALPYIVKMPGKRGGYLFAADDVEALALKRGKHHPACNDRCTVESHYLEES